MREFIGRVGGGIRRFDDAYSTKINAMYEDANPIVRGLVPLVGGGSPVFRKSEPQMDPGPMKTALEYGIPVANAVPKYVLPAAGVTLAGKGLIELATVLSPEQQTSGTVLPQ